MGSRYLDIKSSRKNLTKTNFSISYRIIFYYFLSFYFFFKFIYSIIMQRRLLMVVLTLTLGQFILSSPLPDEDEPKAFVRNERQALAKRRQLLAQRLLGVKDSTDDTCDSQIFYNVEDIKNASLNVKSDCKI